MNVPSIIISVIIAVIFVLIIANEIHKKKIGKCSCSGCSGCSMSKTCHSKK